MSSAVTWVHSVHHYQQLAKSHQDLVTCSVCVCGGGGGGGGGGVCV